MNNISNFQSFILLFKIWYCKKKQSTICRSLLFRCVWRKWRVSKVWVFILSGEVTFGDRRTLFTIFCWWGWGSSDLFSPSAWYKYLLLQRLRHSFSVAPEERRAKRQALFLFYCFLFWKAKKVFEILGVIQISYTQRPMNKLLIAKIWAYLGH